MNTKRTVTVAFLVLLQLTSLLAEQPAETGKIEGFDAFSNALGIYATSLAGDGTGGLHYQHWGKKFGFQGLISAFYDPESTFGRKLDYSCIIDGLYSVYGNTFSRQISGRLYVWASVGHRGYSSSSDYLYDDENQETDRVVFNGIAGLGIGIEIITYGHFSFPVQFGYYGTFPSDPKLSFAGGGGFRYRF
ncbi:MAG: hypothetical protein BWY39_00647 [Spirochaetes bacterium ADurb.Bin269]|jgi:hypothetical protein|nr:MAG: hypothetical protein BWY39_00647 [Spirochaetes bacterium ADurb.Bin269]